LIWNEYVLIITVNRIGAEGARALSECLKSNSSLQFLYLMGKLNHIIYEMNMFLLLQDNNIGDYGATSLSECLKSNSCVQDLDLSRKLNNFNMKWIYSYYYS
jgi:hypothetical protein